MSEFTRKTESDPDEASGGPVLLEHLFRRQAGRLVSCLVRLLGPQHLQLAEDAVQEAMLRAAQRWPFEGAPEKPEGWLYRVAHNFAISALRWNSRFEKQTDGLVEKLEARRELADDLYLDGQLRDAELCMLFMCCHPELSREARLALSLKLVGGFGAGEIARIFLMEESTIAQRLVRAKRLIRDRRLPLTLPGKSELRERLESVLEAIYLMFSAGYAAGAGEQLIRQDVCLEALRLGRLVAASNMALPSADALVALMALQAARLPARTDAAGDLVLLEEQDRRLWDGGLIGIGFTYFELSMRGDEVSAWHVQAAIAATYASAGTPEGIDWAAILGHYDQLLKMQPSPVVALNRAVAVMRVRGAAAGLNELRPLRGHAAMKGYHLLPAVRGQMLVEVGRLAEAEAEFEAALECRCSEPERRFLRRRLETIGIEVGR
jgi:RNA polymerase sigma-70 factor, ECF subfamily